MRLKLINIKTLEHNDAGTKVTGVAVVETYGNPVQIEFAAHIISQPLASVSLPSQPLGVRMRNAETAYQLFEYKHGNAPNIVTTDQLDVLREALFDHVISVHEQLVGTLIKTTD